MFYMFFHLSVTITVKKYSRIFACRKSYEFCNIAKFAKISCTKNILDVASAASKKFAKISYMQIA